MLIKWLFVFLTSIALFSCNEEDIGPQYPDSNKKVPGAPGIWILNEGVWGWGNASISFYDTQRKQMSNRVYSSQQNSPLGDVLQSMYSIEDKRYLIVNYSNYIKVCNSEMALIETISPITSPRYMTQINDSLLAITSFESEMVYKYNTNTKKLSNFAEVEEWSEKIVNISDFIFIEQKSRVNQNPSNQNILKFNLEGDLIQTLPIDEDHNDLIELGNNQFGFISGNSTESKLWISDINFETKTFPTPEKIDQISYSNGRIYLAGQNLWEFNLETEEFNIIMDLKDRNVYGLNSSDDGFVFISDPTSDYTNSGNFLILSLESKSIIDSVKTSFIPSEIYFEK